LQRAIVPSEQDFSAIKEKRAVQKADRLAAENRIADFLTGQRECVADYRRAQPQRFEFGASRILIRNDAIPPQCDQQFHRENPSRPFFIGELDRIVTP
jgi:hypothetical protein